MSNLDLLHDALAEHLSDRAMARKPVSGATIKYDVRGGEHQFTIYVDGALAATARAASLDLAARRCAIELRGWAEDQSAYLENALSVSIQTARDGR